MYSYNKKYVHCRMMPGTLIVQHVTLYHELPVTRLLEVAILQKNSRCTKVRTHFQNIG
jgi:hypothetical protein